MRERKDISPTGKGRGGQGTVWGSLSGDWPHDWGSEERLGRNMLVLTPENTTERTSMILSKMTYMSVKRAGESGRWDCTSCIAFHSLTED